MYQLMWAGFIGFVLVLLALDLGVFNRTPHVISVKESLRWTGIWILVSLTFNVGVYFIYDHGWMQSPAGLPALSGTDAAVQFLTGYIIEKMLSLDNIFVMAAIMASFRVPAESQHRVLYWGVLGALVLRGVMIIAGTAAIRQFSWLIYPLGLLLLVTGVKMFKPEDDEEEELKENFAVTFVRKFWPVTRDFEGTHFVVTQNGRRAVTPLLLALVAIEFTDVIFAVDSVPAVFGVTLDPFIVMTSNVFAILGLRSLYFALRSMLDRFSYLKPTVALILVLDGLKMLAGEALHYHFSPLLSLAVIAVLLTVGVALSLAKER
jgi:tellurite resistance protein TerC